MTYGCVCHRLPLLIALLVLVSAQTLQTSSVPPDIHALQASASPSSSRTPSDQLRETTATTRLLSRSERTADSIPEPLPFPNGNTDSSEDDGSRDHSHDTPDGDEDFPNAPPFTSTSLIEDEVEFWKQTAAAYYDICGMSCYSSDKFIPRNCQSCGCDGACRVYGDCCPDVYAKLGYMPLSGWVDGSVQCSRTFFGSTTRMDYVMVTRCPADADRSLTLECESMATLHWNLTQPVTDIESFVTYKNRFCAQCHSATHIQPWEASIAVINPATVTGIKSPEELYLAVILDADNEVFYTCPKTFDSHARECSFEPPMSECNVTGTWENYDANVEKACQLFTAPMTYHFTKYKNPFCYLCNTWKSWTEVSGDHEEEGMAAANSYYSINRADHTRAKDNNIKSQVKLLFTVQGRCYFVLEENREKMKPNES